MKKQLITLSLVCTAAVLMAASCGNSQTSEAATYENPVIKHNCPDPSILDNRERDGWFYLYSTQNGQNEAEGTKYLPIYRSKNLIDWEYVCDGFGPGRPQWEKGARIWAPDMSYINGKYVIFYALGVWGDMVRSASGVAVSDSPTGPFEDKGMIVSYANTGVENSIDPNFFEDSDGRKYLYWGSLGGDKAGIYVVELTDDGLSIKEGSQPVKLAGNDMEGTYVHKRGKYYYLFASEGSCCEKEKSTYRIIVGRSESPMGPFLSKSGMSMIKPEKYDQVILHGTDDLAFAGPGHDAEIVTDDAGNDWMPYHTYWEGNDYNGRATAIDQVLWTEDGWPYFKDSMPQVIAEAPVLK